MPDTLPKDGRRQRSSRSRRKIIDAMFSLLRDGVMHPGAVAVAERADVGLRTVFRHFEDMDSIYDEMTEEMLARVAPLLEAPYESGRWQDQLVECIDRNAELYELIFPVKLSMGLRRFQSGFLSDQYDRDLEILRAGLKRVLPSDVQDDKVLFASFELALSFEAWRRLRQDQGLSVNEAKTAVKTLLDGLL